MTAAVKTLEAHDEPDWARVKRVIDWQTPDRPLTPDEKMCALWLMLDLGMSIIDIRKRVPGLSRQQATALNQLRDQALGDEGLWGLAPTFEMRYFLGIRGIYRPGSDLTFREIFGAVDW